MGLQQQSERKIYLSVNANGKITQTIKQPAENCITKTLDNGKVIYQMEYYSLEGNITGISFKDHVEYGKFLQITVDDTYILQLKCSTRYFYSFCFQLPCVDFSQPVKLCPYRRQDKDKTVERLYINQKGKAVDWHFRKGESKGMPDWELIKVKGKETWDDTKRLEFIENLIKEAIVPLIGQKAVNPDDLPF